MIEWNDLFIIFVIVNVGVKTNLDDYELIYLINMNWKIELSKKK